MYLADWQHTHVMLVTQISFHKISPPDGRMPSTPAISSDLARAVREREPLERERAVREREPLEREREPSRVSG